MGYLNPEKVRQILFIAILVIMGWILFREMQTFIPAFLGALTFYVLMRKWMLKLEEKKWKPALAASLLMLLSFLIILLPFYTIINMLSSKIAYVFQHSHEITDGAINYINKLEQKLGYDIVNDDNIKKLVELSASKMPSILGATLNTLTTILFMYFILFFMLTESKSIEQTFHNILPVNNKNLVSIRKEINTMVMSNAIGIPLIAILQSIVAFIGYLIIGVENPGMWFVITCFGAMMPVVGAAVGYIPIAIIFFAEGDNARGIIMLIFGFGIVGAVDNIFRFWLQKKIGNVHPLITVFGVIIGIKLFGFIGLIFGPLLISMFLLLLHIYQIEFSSFKKTTDTAVSEIPPSSEAPAQNDIV